MATLKLKAKKAPKTAVTAIEAIPSPESAIQALHLRQEQRALAKLHRIAHKNGLRPRCSGLIQFFYGREAGAGHIRIDLRDPNRIKYAVCHIDESGDTHWKPSTLSQAARCLGLDFWYDLQKALNEPDDSTEQY